MIKGSTVLGQAVRYLPGGLLRVRGALSKFARTRHGGGVHRSVIADALTAAPARIE